MDQRSAEVELLSLAARSQADAIWECGVGMTDEEYEEASAYLARVCAAADAEIAAGVDVRDVVKARLDRARQAIAGPRQQPLYFSKFIDGGNEEISAVLMLDRAQTL